MTPSERFRRSRFCFILVAGCTAPMVVLSFFVPVSQTAVVIDSFMLGAAVIAISSATLVIRLSSMVEDLLASNTLLRGANAELARVNYEMSLVYPAYRGPMIENDDGETKALDC
jgi:hypothetical protein